MISDLNEQLICSKKLTLRSQFKLNQYCMKAKKSCQIHALLRLRRAICSERYPVRIPSS